MAPPPGAAAMPIGRKTTPAAANDPFEVSVPPEAILYCDTEPPTPLVTYRKLPDGLIAIRCGELPGPSPTEPIAASAPLAVSTLNSRTRWSAELATYRNPLEELSASPVGPDAAPIAVVPISVSAPPVRSRLNSLSVPSRLLLANTSPAVGVAVGEALDVALEEEVGVTSVPVRKP